MDADLYQRAAARSLPREGAPGRSLAVLGLGLAGEAGEVVELIKKHVGHGHELDREKLAKEIGDVLWYAAGLCTLLGIDLGDVMQANVEKLRRRYPEGFDPARSQDRSGETSGALQDNDAPGFSDAEMRAEVARLRAWAEGVEQELERSNSRAKALARDLLERAETAERALADVKAGGAA